MNTSNFISILKLTIVLFTIYSCNPKKKESIIKNETGAEVISLNRQFKLESSDGKTVKIENPSTEVVDISRTIKVTKKQKKQLLEKIHELKLNVNGKEVIYKVDGN